MLSSAFLKSGTGSYGRSTISDGDWLYIWVTAVYLGHGCVAQSHWLRHATFVQIAVELPFILRDQPTALVKNILYSRPPLPLLRP